MPRPSSLEFAGATYHVTVRGVQQSAIFVDDDDRMTLLAILARMLRTCRAQAFAFCLMDNHYHLVLQTREANLSSLMHRINSQYSLTFNRRHGRAGHLIEGRFKALLVDRDAYLLEVCRYVDLNPVRVSMVDLPGQWRWSSYRAHVGRAQAPPWLATMELHGMLTGGLARDRAQVDAARQRYAQWVEQGRDVRLWSRSLRDGLYLGDEAFVERMKEAVP
jgi:REP element-mobilizing transposase RayT